MAMKRKSLLVCQGLADRNREESPAEVPSVFFISNTWETKTTEILFFSQMKYFTFLWSFSVWIHDCSEREI